MVIPESLHISCITWAKYLLFLGLTFRHKVSIIKTLRDAFKLSLVRNHKTTDGDSCIHYGFRATIEKEKDLFIYFK